MLSRLNARVRAERLTALWAIAIFALNAWICRPLFRTGYLPHMFSIEAAYIALTRWVGENWGDLTWFPLWNAGEPFQNTYQPGLPVICALVAKIFHLSPALAYHITIASFYCLGPVGVFLLGYRLSGRRAIGVVAALLYSVLSPSAFLVPVIRHDLGSVWFARRYYALVFYGEGPNVSGLNIAPFALLGIDAVYRKLSASRFLFAAVLLALTVIVSWPASVVLAMGTLAYLLAKDWSEVREKLASLFCLATAGYLLIAPWDPPSTIRDNQRNSQLIGGPYHYTSTHILYFLMLALALIGGRMLFRCFKADRFLEFSFYFFLVPGAVALSAHWYRIALLPQPERFHVGMEIGIVLLIAWGIVRVMRINRTAWWVVAALLACGTAEQARNYARFAGRITRPIDISRTVEYEIAAWLDRNMHGQRVFAAGSTQFWMNAWTDQPQVDGCCLPGLPNPMGWIVSWQVSSGAGTGSRDAEFALLWMRAYGAQAVSVAGEHSRDSYRDWPNPKKFEGVLPEVWADGDDRIYRIPSRTVSLAHVLHQGEVVPRSPVNGIDIDPLVPFVRALEDRTRPEASWFWLNHHQARIVADVAPGDVVSVQETYVPGWRAEIDGHPANLRRDGLGLMVIEPRAAGHTVVDLIYDGGTEAKVLRVVSATCWALLVGWLAWGVVARLKRREVPALAKPRPGNPEGPG